MADTAGGGDEGGLGIGALSPSSAENEYFETGGASGLPGGEQQDAPPADGDEPDEARVENEPLDVQNTRLKAALFEARNEKRAAKRRATELEKTAMARVEQLNQAIARLGQGQQQAQQAQQPERPAPDKEKDFSGWLAHQVETTGRTQQQILNALNGQQQQAAQQQQFTAFLGAYNSATEAFRQEAPDYDAAFDFVREARGKQLQALGHDEDEVEQILNGEEEFIARRAMSSGANPAERFYALAKTMGYAPGAGKGSQPRQDGRLTLATVQRGQAASRSLGATGGSPPPGQLTLDTIAKMPASEFDKILSDPRKLAQLDGLMGKRAPARGSFFS